MRRLLLTLVLSLGLPATAEARTSWAARSIDVVLGRGLLPGLTASSFRPQGAVDGVMLTSLVAGALPRGGAQLSDAAPGYVTIGRLDAAFVRAAGLGPAADAAGVALRRAGYQPRADVGTELAARILGLRYDHPASEDALEHAADELTTRAEAAYTTAKVLGWQGWEPAYAQGILARLAGLPATSGPRHDAIQRAVSLIGQPYVWGGEWERPDGPLGPQAHGGFDCSGLLWRVLALDPASVPGTDKRLAGRSSYDMAAAPGRRLGRPAVHPGDLLFFGSAGSQSAPGQIGHAGLDMGNGLMIHSSTQGVQISRWDTGYHAEVFAWGRSVLPR